MKLKIIFRVLLLMLFGCSILLLNAQTGIPAAGGNATGTGGSVSFSVGQVFYVMNTGTTGSVLQGVQQPWEISQSEGKTQLLTFSGGWNLFSFNTLPFNTDMKVIFQPLIDAGRLIKIQDENGKALEDFGIFGGWVNNIGAVSLTEGYKAKMTLACQLTVVGSETVLPYIIPLSAGWNIIGFPYDIPVDGMGVVQQLITRGTLIKVQDETGRAIEDLGIFGGWVNNIGNFIPGKGYKVKTSGADNLTIQASYSKSGIIDMPIAATVHFRTIAEGNGVDHMNINLVGMKEGVWHPGDEIGVFDGNLCVGSVALLPGHIASRRVEVTASASDDTDGRGFTEGRPFRLRLWNRESDNEYLLEPEILKGTTTFLKHESTLASVERIDIRGLEDRKLTEGRQVSCYPNPTRGKVHLRIADFPTDGIRVEVMNTLGQTLMTREMSAEPVTIDLSGHVSGIYYIRVSNRQWYETERIILK
jgi:hypothetical protein